MGRHSVPTESFQTSCESPTVLFAGNDGLNVVGWTATQKLVASLLRIRIKKKLVTFMSRAGAKYETSYLKLIEFCRFAFEWIFFLARTVSSLSLIHI